MRSYLECASRFEWGRAHCVSRPSLRLVESKNRSRVLLELDQVGSDRFENPRADSRNL